MTFREQAERIAPMCSVCRTPYWKRLEKQHIKSEGHQVRLAQMRLALHRDKYRG